MVLVVGLGGLVACASPDPQQHVFEDAAPRFDAGPDAGGGVSARQVDTSRFLQTFILNASPGGIVLNGLNLGPLNVASIDADSLSALNSEALSASGETMGDVQRQILSYAYSCAMPASSSMKLKIGGETWLFEGAVGLAPEWETGACDQECQEWVSACILARTNQFGVKVQLSLRGDHPALAVPAQVASDFTLREGSFYGNIFKSSTTVAGAAYSCAGGRGSAIWELTARFCSALGDGCPIKAVADCNINEFACDIENRGCSSYTACSEWDANGHPTTCYSDFHVCGQAPVGTAYSHVITTYLRPPTTNCGNDICEEGEAETCAADCANHWAQRFGSGCHEDAGDLSQDQNSGGLNLTGRFIGDIEFGDITLSTSGSDNSDLFVASLDAGGRANWARALDAIGDQAMARSVTNDSNGNVIVAGHYANQINLGNGTRSASGFSFFIAKYAQSDGAHIWSRHFETSRWQWVTNLAVLPTIRVVADSNDGVVIATDFTGTIDLGLAGNNNPTSSSRRDILVARFDSNGVLDWYRHLPGEGNQALLSLALDSNDNIIIGGTLQGNLVVGDTTLVGSGSFEDAFVARLSPIGAPQWAIQLAGTEGAKTLLDIAIGESDSIVIVGQYRGDMRIGATAVASSTLGMESGLASNDAFVAKLTSAGALEWARTFGGGRTDVASKVVWDGVGSYVVSSVVTAEVTGSVNVEGTVLETGEYGDIVLIRYAPDGTAESVTRRGSPVTEETKGLVATDSGIVLTGEFMGTLRFGGTYLTNAGGSWTDVQPADIFLTRIDFLP